MSTDTGAKFRDALVAMMAPDMNTTAVALVDAFLNQEVRYNVYQPLDTAAATASTITLDSSTLLAMRAKTFKIVVGTTVTADNTNYAALNLVYNNGNGGSDTVIAVANTTIPGATAASNNITAGTAFSFTISNTATIPAGSQIQVKITKVATGYALPSRSFEFKGVAV